MSFLMRLLSGSVVVLAVMILLAGCEPATVPSATQVLHFDGSPLELCAEGSMKQSRKGGSFELTCDLRLIDLQFLAHDSPPGAVFAKVECSCKDKPDGSFGCPTCTCQEDAASNCKSFLAECAATGGDALGAGDIGICNRN